MTKQFSKEDFEAARAAFDPDKQDTVNEWHRQVDAARAAGHDVVDLADKNAGPVERVKKASLRPKGSAPVAAPADPGNSSPHEKVGEIGGETKIEGDADMHGGLKSKKR